VDRVDPGSFLPKCLEPCIQIWFPQGERPANAIRYQLKIFWDLTVIEAFSDQQFLPSYGFPIGVQGLQVLLPDEDDPKRIHALWVPRRSVTTDTIFHLKRELNVR
jgi:hypothetical protein